MATGDPAFTRLCPSLLQCGTKWETTSGSDGFYYAQNLEEAKQLLEEAGVTGAHVRLMDPADRQPAHAAAQVSREVLTALGFDVDFQVMDWATMVAQRARPDDWEFFHTWSGVTVRSGPVGHLLFSELQYDAWFNNYQDTTGKQREIYSRLARATTEGRADCAERRVPHALLRGRDILAGRRVLQPLGGKHERPWNRQRRLGAAKALRQVACRITRPM